MQTTSPVSLGEGTFSQPVPDDLTTTFLSFITRVRFRDGLAVQADRNRNIVGVFYQRRRRRAWFQDSGRVITRRTGV